MEKDIIYTKIHSTMHDYTGNVQLQNKWLFAKMCHAVWKRTKVFTIPKQGYTIKKLIEQVE